MTFEVLSSLQRDAKIIAEGRAIDVHIGYYIIFCFNLLYRNLYFDFFFKDFRLARTSHTVNSHSMLRLLTQRISREKTKTKL